MKKIYLLACLSIVLFDCSSDDSSPGMEGETLEPTVENISTANATAGDIITINGKNFDPAETYIVKFNDIEGDITEIQPSFLKVQVPENATSGDITLTANGKTTVVGTITIAPQTPMAGVFIFQQGVDKIAQINIENGNLTYVGENIQYGINTRGAVVHAKNNEYLGFENSIGGSPNLVRVNLETGTTTYVPIPSSFLSNGSDFDDLTIDNNDNLYIFHFSEKKLAKINIETGDLTYIGADINYGVNTRGAVIHNTNNEYIGFEVVDMQVYLLRINLDNGDVTTVDIPQSFLTSGSDFSDLAIDTEDNLYIFHDSVNKLAKIDVSTGNLTYIGENIDYGRNTLGAVIDSKTKEYIGFEYDFVQPYFMRINLETGASTKIVIPNEFLPDNFDFDDLALRK